MKYVTPHFFKDFKCKGGSCRHNCCIGWEIDIDSETLELYRSTESSLRRRFENCISSDDEPHFILDKNERCPFLNKDNLCDIILEMGEGSLCQICSDHPRFRNFLSSRTEEGVGLCCEEACRLLLENKSALTFDEYGQDGECDEDEKYLLSLRRELFSILQNRSLPLGTRINMMLEMCGTDMPKKSITQWAHEYMKLERLDEQWTNALDSICTDIDTSRFDDEYGDIEYQYEHFICYWLFRHFIDSAYDYGIEAAVRLSVLSYNIIHAVDAAYFSSIGIFSTEQRAEHIRMYSAEIEYCAENLDTLHSLLL